MCKCSKNSFIAVLVYFNFTRDYKEFLSELEEVIDLHRNNFPGFRVIIGGDFNARVGNLNDLVIPRVSEEYNINISRISKDSVYNTRGSQLLSFAERLGIILYNGRSYSDTPGQYTHVSANGNSVIDFVWGLPIARNIYGSEGFANYYEI